ncbi:hypothetical protein [Streptosporangium sp. NPDC006007]|uniref:hypothetical protein n=1 Tax=Streptosporangium sp. NPDC006007 TaxID=3154575 RepID=UPI0033B23D8D
MPLDPKAHYWTMVDIAEYLGVKLRSVHTCRLRGQKGEPGGLPKGDKVLGRTPVWKPVRVIRWNEQERPGQGVGGGRPRKSETTDEES